MSLKLIGSLLYLKMTVSTRSAQAATDSIAKVISTPEGSTKFFGNLRDLVTELKPTAPIDKIETLLQAVEAVLRS